LDPQGHDWSQFFGSFHDVIDRSNEPNLWLKVFWILGSNASLEPLIDFLAFLVQKLCQKSSKYFRNSLGDQWGFP